MKKLLLLLCLVAIAIGSMNAGPVDQQKAQQLGAKFLGNSQLRLAATVADRGVADYYAFNAGNGEGFVIVAADDRVKPVLAYSTTGHFDPDRVSEGFQFTLNTFCEEIHYVREHNLSAIPDITFQLHDAGSDGWKGACISVTSENGQRIAIVGMDEGSEKTVTLPLLKGNLNFIWNSGWFHSYPGWDTDHECSFSILNADDEEVYVSSDLQAGIFLTYGNDCEINDVAEIVSESVPIYPNPTNGLLNVGGNGKMHITVSNLLGQKIMEVNVEDHTTLDLSGNESGIYLVRIESADGVKVQKVNLQEQ